MSSSGDQIRAGDLAGAQATLIDTVKADPGDAKRRIELAEVLIAAGDLERADTHLGAAQGLDTSFAVAIALTRQLVRAAVWRNEVFEKGRAPELVSERTIAVDAGLAALLAERDGAPGTPDDDPALEAIAGTIDGRAFTGWRDADDRTAGVLEVLTSTGNYVWVPLSAVKSLKLLPVERLRDVVWRGAELDIDGGPSGVVYLPTIYHAPVTELTDAYRLGRATDWVEGARVRGLGLRTWLLGDDALSPTDFTLIERS